jgi:hypothetical protein
MSLKNLDSFINTFSKGISDLRYYESVNKQENYTHHLKLFTQLKTILFKRSKYIIDQELWKELYLRSVYFYQFHKKVNNVPLIMVTKHNQIVPFYMSQRVHSTNSTLVHFDTHSDEAPVTNSALLPKIYKIYLETADEKCLDKVSDIVWDIGAANSGILYTTGIRDVTWCLPSWVPDKQISVPIFLKNKKNTQTLSTTDNIKHLYNLDELTQTTRVPKDAVKKTYTKVQTGKLTKVGFNKLVETIKKNGKKYILDIDLDYIVCNGKPFTQSYWKETYDLSSYYRNFTFEPNQFTPRYNADNTTELLQCTKRFNFEIKEINKRIKTLFTLLFSLKKKGYIPELISICDSTNLQFSDCQVLSLHSCNSVSNNYVPLNIALYVHSKVLRYIEKLTI